MITMLRIDRKAHHRKGFSRKGRLIKPTSVKRTIFLAKDRGKRGRGKPILPASFEHKPMLGEGFFDKSQNAQKRILAGAVRRRGEMPVQGKLQYIANLQRRTNPEVSRKASRLRGFVAKNFEGRNRVR